MVVVWSLRRLTGLVVACISFHDAVVEPHVRHSHAVLSEGACLVGADGRRGAQSLHRFQVLHQTVFARHSLRRQRQAHLGSVRMTVKMTKRFKSFRKLTVTVAKRPSGTLATIIPIRKMTASSQSYPRRKAMMKKVTPKKTATAVMRWIKWAISLAIGVEPLSRPEARPAILPITVLSPVLITQPMQVPGGAINLIHTTIHFQAAKNTFQKEQNKKINLFKNLSNEDTA